MGDAVAVEVGAEVGVWVAGTVAVEGRGEAVEAGTVAVTGIFPQAVKNKINPNVNVKIFFINFLEWMIEIPEDVQAIEREPGGDDLNDIGFLCHNFRQPAGGNDFHAGSQFLAKTFDHALDHAHVPK